MAIHKYSGLWSRLDCGLWMSFVLILSLIHLRFVLANCLGIDSNPVTIYPTGTVLVKYGEPLEIFCIDETSSSTDLEFYVERNIIPSEVVNTTTRRLYIEKPEKQLSVYTCKNKIDNNICVTRVLVDSPPDDVTDFACRSHNLEVLNCTWTSPKNGKTKPIYNLTPLLHNHPVQPCHVTRVGNARYSCVLTTYSQPRYRQLEKEYVFNLTTCNGFGCNIQFITIDHFSIVKLNPPNKLISVYNYTHGVLLQWNIDNTLDLLPDGVDHRIEYQIAKIDNMTYFRSVDASSLPAKNRTYKFLLSDLPYAHMQYEVRIYIKCRGATNGGIWSDFTYKLIYTTSERPKRPPDTTVGAFGQAVYNTKRMIYICWKQLEEYEEAGSNFTYKVVATSNNKNPRTLIADKNKSLSYVILENASLEAIDISIWSINNNGSSINSSSLYIPPVTDTKLKVTSFTKIAYENGTYKLSWSEAQNIDNYTLFWCIHITTWLCAGRMDFTVLNANQTTYVIDLPKEHRYQFAVSANYGKKTSGMVWSICDISKATIQMYDLGVKMDNDAPGTSFVKIKWTMDCILYDDLITGYQISYCPVLANGNGCTRNPTILNITNPKQLEINITNLEPSTTYSFTLAINTTYGLRTVENASTIVTTFEATPISL